MIGLIEKLETDIATRVRAGKILSSILCIVSVAAVVMVFYVSWGMSS